MIVPPAIPLGLIYPALLKSVPAVDPSADREEGAWFAGYMSAANSLGCLAGALLSTFVLIDRLGSEKSLKTIILLIGALWLVFEFRTQGTGAPNPRESRKRWENRLAGAFLAALLIAGVWATNWNLEHLTAGASMYFGEYPEVWKTAGTGDAGSTNSSSMLFREESVQGGFTTVLLKRTGSPGSQRSSIHLFTNGKLQGNDDQSGMVQGQQVGTAVLPSLFTKHFKRALLIGLGIGHGAAMLKQFSSNGWISPSCRRESCTRWMPNFARSAPVSWPIRRCIVHSRMDATYC